MNVQKNRVDFAIFFVIGDEVWPHADKATSKGIWGQGDQLISCTTLGPIASLKFRCRLDEYL